MYLLSPFIEIMTLEEKIGHHDSETNMNGRTRINIARRKDDIYCHYRLARFVSLWSSNT